MNTALVSTTVLVRLGKRRPRWVRVGRIVGYPAISTLLATSCATEERSSAQGDATSASSCSCLERIFDMRLPEAAENVECRHEENILGAVYGEFFGWRFQPLVEADGDSFASLNGFRGIVRR